MDYFKKLVNLGGMGGECFPENIFYFTGYTGRMVRMAVLRDWDAICEEGNEGVLESDLKSGEEKVILWNVSLLKKTDILRGATE